MRPCGCLGAFSIAWTATAAAAAATAATASIATAAAVATPFPPPLALLPPPRALPAAAARLKYVLACGSAVVMPESPWEEFWYHLLQPGTNVIVTDPGKLHQGG